jgi:glycosyltransferase involved in cell wall biosynthesis
MKIVLDPQIFHEQKFGGISRYYAEIYSNLLFDKNTNILLPLTFSENLHVKQLLPKISFTYNFFIKNNIFRKKAYRTLKRKETKDFIQILKKQDFDVFIPTYYNPKSIELIEKKPFVLTVYDMIHELFPEHYPDDFSTISNKKILIEKATKIIAISESTKRDILKIYPDIDSTKIEIVYLSCSIDNSKTIQINLPKNYILFVGNRTIYKNFIFFLKSVAPILKNDSNLYIVCAGGNSFNSEETALISDLNLTYQLIQQNFEDFELSSYYSQAKCFVFASEYEGFGIPVLESMKCGCPVVLANHSSFPEVAGDAGVYFELNNPNDLHDKVSSLLQNDDLRTEYSKKGLIQAEKFSWKKTVDDCLKVYQKAIDNV